MGYICIVKCIFVLLIAHCTGHTAFDYSWIAEHILPFLNDWVSPWRKGRKNIEILSTHLWIDFFAQNYSLRSQGCLHSPFPLSLSHHFCSCLLSFFDFTIPLFFSHILHFHFFSPFWFSHLLLIAFIFNLLSSASTEEKILLSCKI